jgi:hypothetical protein
MTAPESLGMSATPSTDSALSEATTEPNISIFIFIYFFIYKRLQTKSHQKMSTPVNVELSQFVAHNVPRVLRALSDAMARISHLLSDAQVETFQVRSSDAVRAANQTSANAPPPVVMTMMGPAAAAPTGPPPVVTVPVLSATLELRGTSFELDARLVDRKRGTSVPPMRHVITGHLPRLASLLRCCQAALAALNGAAERLDEADSVSLLALLDTVDESIRCARQFLSRSSAVGISVQAIVERAAQHTVQPATAGGLVFDVMAEDVALSVVAGFSDLALPAGSTPSRKAPWRALKARIRPNDADRQQRSYCAIDVALCLRVECAATSANRAVDMQCDVESSTSESIGVAEH